MKNSLLFLFGLLALPFLQGQNANFKASDIDVPFQRFVLPNGLRLIVHEDHKAPVAAVNIWYHVGSKNEKVGKSGFAHLFEHLMFNGSEHYNTDYFQALEAIGATDLNGTTNKDRTNYFQTVPVSALDQVLWLESDRMGHLLGAIDQGKLDEQRGVVQNEKRQNENQPYAREYEMIQKTLFPPHHPYGHTVIGEMEDLNAASLEDVHEWFKAYYGAANAVLVVAGDVDTKDVYERVLRYFGNIPAGPTILRPEKNIPKHHGEMRQSYQDRVPNAKVDFAWVGPDVSAEDAVFMDLVTDVLSSGKNSRLYKKLVYESQLATRAYSYSSPSEIAGEIHIGATVKAGKTPEEVERAMNEVLQEFLRTGPTAEEVQRVKSAYFANSIKGLERIGGFGGKSDLLAYNEIYGGSPDAYKKDLALYERATARDLHEAAKRWMSDGRLVTVCTPFPTYVVSGKEADRSKIPALAETPSVAFPTIQRATLSNGMKVVLTERKGSPAIEANIMFDAGYVSDHLTNKPGLAALSMNMLDEGSKTQSGLEINEKLQTLGASLNTYSTLENAYISLSGLQNTFDASLDIMADVALNPAFSETDFSRLRDLQVSDIAGEKKQPFGMIRRVMPKIFYGEGHPYSMPMTGTGNEESVKSLTVKDVQSYYGQYIRPNNATIVVTGDISLKDLTAKLEQRFSKWQKGEVPKVTVPKVSADAGKGKIYLIDRPESIQSFIVSGYLMPEYGAYNEIALEQMQNVLGADFTSRINLNIREDKHWSYGARATIMPVKGQRPFYVYAPVQTDKTKESMIEIQKEVKVFVGEKPMTAAEFEKTKQNTVLSMAGMWETNSSVNTSARELVKFGLADSYWNGYSASVKGLSLDQVHSTAQKAIQPGSLSWIVVGDKAKILDGLKELNMEIIELDANGQEVAKKTKP